ncbi:membrane integrity-associated transporter subunit PqiC [Acidovorax sp. JG5]|uniref:ABC-type transport auxiliary lipoprotein family protein n=1 Tax=Acidovorax sp. JG5 TaxID=2822718 RepID=UPI001B33B1EC|nr:ABC-type transport auxiliary lipoprotein family protein [Acidovorax sp. JG5]MBP3979569.1 membrane integrity-associated transporter subunit PqiC [Acidovorax sp. JG5]
MKTIKIIAVSAYGISAGAIFVAAFLAGCSALPAPPSRPVHYDFGPGAMAPVPADRRAPLPPLALADVEAPGLAEGSTAVLYRLAYAEARQLRPYTQARWSQPPAQLVQQHLRDQLGQRRAVLTAESGAAQARASGKLPVVLRVELEEFSQVFTSATESAGLVRLRATLAEPAQAGETLLGQRVFIVQRPAASADAAGGTRALAEATDQVAHELTQWLEQLGR